MLNIIFPFTDFLYLLQVEEYESKRYFKLLPRFFFRRELQKRSKLVFTSRIRTTFLVSVAFTVFFGIFINIISILLIPVWVLIANIILAPLYNSFKNRIQKDANKYFSSHFTGKVIAIAGSYGKTTTKNMINEIVKYNYKVQMVPGNINTPTGIGNWILQKLEDKTEILIVEMDTYFIGEIEKSCKITPPDIAVLTNIGDQHIERLGSRENLKRALFEVFRFAKKDATLITSKGISFKDSKNKKIIQLNKPENEDYAKEVAKVLNIPDDIVKDSLKKFETPDRRHKAITMHGFKTIDDSYNISFATAKHGLEKAMKEAKALKKNLVVITGGIPELGKENADSNIKYGELLAKSKADVVLLETILHEDIKKGLGEKNPLMAEGMTDAWEIIQKEFSPKKVLILMQPELGDNYY